jgi:hypothetical protein
VVVSVTTPQREGVSQSYPVVVQLIEVSDFGVRAAEIWLSRQETPLRFVLFPMLHLGSVEYYAEVTHRVRQCQLVVAEGVVGKSAALTALTAVYRIPGRGNRHGLTTQDIDLSSLDVPLINPDITSEQFNAGWRGLPVLFRLGVAILAPLLGVWVALVGLRVALARHLEIDDLPTRGEILASRGRLEQLEQLVIHSRDKRLIDCIEDIHQRHALDKIDVAVVYGAAHMRALVEYLSVRHDYFAKDAQWITVFDF